ncbi:GreA/GreB family elongation factor [Alkalilimnicola ehrlichii]|uniref:GreA/GreB family elongation factor n=1 Tax=Alkalilimnicola ehrlichii TaxID=351052 RepID=UPI00216233A7|nr:GreA/GreB family elongation factor [Alkalilimnicola ehrlichii]
MTKRLDGITVVDRAPDDQSRIYFGAWFELEDEDGELYRYRVVGPDELDLDRGWISMDSPLGRAVMRKGLDDEVRVSLPKGEAVYVVTDIRYAPFE